MMQEVNPWVLSERNPTPMFWQHPGQLFEVLDTEGEQTAIFLRLCSPAHWRGGDRAFHSSTPSFGQANRKERRIHAEVTVGEPTPGFLPGESHGQRSLVVYSPRGREELDTMEWLTHTMTETHLKMVVEGGEISGRWRTLKDGQTNILEFTVKSQRNISWNI